ncbi:MAG: ATP-binding domain-containing protein, partial [Psychromonas sp.]|nr:ATP-binding domain-containing protein [Psychromonas sp.]
NYLCALKGANNVQEIFDTFTQFCILTATHNGYCGRVEINRLCQQILGFTDDNHWYHGRPVMVTKNDYQTELYNGDVGICLNIAEHDDAPSYRVFFPTSAGFKDYIPSRVPVHEVAFAMTVHKAQGSEFNEVLFLMPDKAVRVLSKELVYTAITRAKEKVELWGKSDVFLSTKVES